MSIGSLATLLCILLACSSSPAEPDGQDRFSVRAIDQYLEEQAEHGFSGVVLLAEEDRVLLEQGYGWADRARKRPNTRETIFNICSVSKTFTAAAVMKLEERGSLRTSDAIREYLGEFPGTKDDATIHQLLIHTAGLAKAGTSLDYESRDAFVESMKRAPIESSPGDAFRYTNAGYTLLAAVVEEVSRLPFEDFLAQQLFEPAGLQDTAFVWDERIDSERLAIGYRGESLESLEPVARDVDVWGERGPGSLGSTAPDLHRWVLALRGGEVLSAQSLERVFTVYERDDGYGWHLGEHPFGSRIDKGCGTRQSEGQVAIYPNQGLVLVILMNNNLGFRRTVWQGIESRLFASDDE